MCYGFNASGGTLYATVCSSFPVQQYFQFTNSWSGSLLRSGDPDPNDIFDKIGCCVTSLAMGMSFYGVNKTPPDMSTYISGAKLWSGTTAGVDLLVFVPGGSSALASVFH